jgi:hypothetical protein
VPKITKQERRQNDGAVGLEGCRETIEGQASLVGHVCVMRRGRRAVERLPSSGRSVPSARHNGCVRAPRPMPVRFANAFER